MRPRPRSRPTSLALLTAALAASAALPPAAGASRAERPPSVCGELRGRDLAPGNPTLKVVRVRDVQREGATSLGRRGHAYLGCTGRFGRVRELGFSGADIADGGEVSRSRFTLVATAGSWIVARDRYATLTGEDGETWTAYDVVSRRSYPLWARQSEAGPQTALPAPTAAVVDPAGRSAAIFAGAVDESADALPAGATAGVATFDVGGERVLVDSGGAEIAGRSLRLAGTVATWTHGGQPRSTDLATRRGIAPAGGHPIDCGVTPSGTYRLQVATGTPCEFAVRTYAAFVRFLDEDAIGLIAGVERSFRVTAQSPATGRTVQLRARAIPRAHGEFDLLFRSIPAGLSVRFNNLTLP